RVQMLQAAIHFCQCRIVAVVEHQDWRFRPLRLQRLTQSNSARLRNRVAHQNQIHERESWHSKKLQDVRIASECYDRMSKPVQERSSGTLQGFITADRYD